MKKRTIFIIFAYAWSAIFWILAISYAEKTGTTLLTNEELVASVLDGDFQINTPTLMSFFAGYGPLLAAVAVFILSKESLNKFKSLWTFKFDFRYLLQIVAIISLIAILPVVVFSFLSTDLNFTTNYSFIEIIFFLVVFLIYQFFTASTEEIGWRGYLLPDLQNGKISRWRASVLVGITWSLWHLPILLYIYIQQELTLFTIVLSLIGFIVGTIGMSAVHTYYLIETRSVFFAMIIHTLFNTVPMTIGLLFTNSFQVSIITQIGIWIVIAFIERRKGKIFDEVLDI